MRITALALSLATLLGCAPRVGRVEPSVSKAESVPVYFETKGRQGIYISGFDQPYFSERGVKVRKGQPLTMVFAIANGLEDDIFIETDTPIAQVTEITTPTGWEQSGMPVFSGSTYKHVRGAYSFISRGTCIDDGFVVGRATLPDHSEGKSCDVEATVSFSLRFCIRRTGKWCYLRPSRQVHVHYE